MFPRMSLCNPHWSQLNVKTQVQGQNMAHCILIKPHLTLFPYFLLLTIIYFYLASSFILCLLLLSLNYLEVLHLRLGMGICVWCHEYCIMTPWKVSGEVNKTIMLQRSKLSVRCKCSCACCYGKQYVDKGPDCSVMVSNFSFFFCF